jgi:signal transduction histidine kinase
MTEYGTDGLPEDQSQEEGVLVEPEEGLDQERIVVRYVFSPEVEEDKMGTQAVKRVTEVLMVAQVWAQKSEAKMTGKGAQEYLPEMLAGVEVMVPLISKSAKVLPHSKTGQLLDRKKELEELQDMLEEMPGPMKDTQGFKTREIEVMVSSKERIVQIQELLAGVVHDAGHGTSQLLFVSRFLERGFKLEDMVGDERLLDVVIHGMQRISQEVELGLPLLNPEFLNEKLKMMRSQVLEGWLLDKMNGIAAAQMKAFYAKETAGEQVEMKPVQFNFDPETEAKVLGNEALLEKFAINVVSNAIKSAHYAGRGEANIMVGSRSTETHWIIDIENSGSTPHQEVLEKQFGDELTVWGEEQVLTEEVVATMTPDDLERRKGTGKGMRGVKDLVERVKYGDAHGIVRISVRPDGEPGARVSLWLPLVGKK